MVWARLAEDVAAVNLNMAIREPPHYFIRWLANVRVFYPGFPKSGNFFGRYSLDSIACARDFAMRRTTPFWRILPLSN